MKLKLVPFINLYLGLLVTLFTSSFIQSQNIPKDEEFKFYREDQIYFGTSLMLIKSNQEDLKARGLPRHFQFGIIRDMPLIKSGKLSTGLGLGISFERFTTNLIRSATGLYLLDLNNNIYNPLSISVQSFEIPISIRWRNSSDRDFAFWRVYGGIKVKWNYRIKAKQNSSFLTIGEEFKKFGTNAYLSFGYNTWNFYLSSPIVSTFDSLNSNQNNSLIKIVPLKVGLIFFIL